MKYNQIKYTDGRHRYNHWFYAYISFSKQMFSNHGPVYFMKAFDWFTQTYDSSAEIRQWAEIKKFSELTLLYPIGVDESLTDKHANPHWSWSNGSDDLRIYIKGEKELSLFLLSHNIA